MTSVHVAKRPSDQVRGRRNLTNRVVLGLEPLGPLSAPVILGEGHCSETRDPLPDCASGFLGILSYFINWFTLLIIFGMLLLSKTTAMSETRRNPPPGFSYCVHGMAFPPA